MKHTGHAPGLPLPAWARPVLGACLIAVLMGVAIAWRIADRSGAPGPVPILIWQSAVWLPWIGYFHLIRVLAGRRAPLRAPGFAGAALHGVLALAVAASHLLWYWKVSDLVSPLRGMPHTRFGVYAFFFVFWFLIDLLLYLAVLVAQPARRRESSSPAASTAPPGRSETGRKQFVVRRGRARYLVCEDEIAWIEAQGYYAACIRKRALTWCGSLSPAWRASWTRRDSSASIARPSSTWPVSRPCRPSATGS
ncbi:MAG TPA: hypothetical protein VE175_09395 [Woeseiaceae bacterium]|nr:hypothetical protein [Woeseiaceae bacterium]